MRNIKTRRTIIFVITALAMVLVSWAYIAVPTGVKQMDLVTTEGNSVGETLEIYVGTEMQLSCRVRPTFFESRVVEYAIADKEIATIDENGLLKALKEGETLLTVECAGARKNYTVKAETAVEDIKGLDKEVTLYVGDEMQLEPKIKMAKKGLEKPEIIYKVKRNTIANVDKKGLITALKEGETTVSVSAGNVSKKVKVIVEERPVEAYTPVVTANDKTDDNNNKTTKRAKKNRKKTEGDGTEEGAGGDASGKPGGNDTEADTSGDGSSGGSGGGTDNGSSGSTTGGGSESGSGDSSE